MKTAIAMTTSDVVKAANDVVKAHMHDGWFISAGDKGSGYWFKVDMENDCGEKIRIGVMGRMLEGLHFLDSLKLRIEYLNDMGWVNDAKEAIEIATFYEIDARKGVWTPDKEVALAEFNARNAS